MYKTLIAVLVVLVALTGISFAGGQEETGEYELLWLTAGDQMDYDRSLIGAPADYEGGAFSYIADSYMAEHPNVKLNLMIRDVAKGTMTPDSLMAAGTPPDVWMDANSQFAKYLGPHYALPMEQYVDTSIYQDALVQAFTRDGHVYALPQMNIPVGLAINLKMAREIGYALPSQKEWTTDEYMRLGAKLKSAGKYLNIAMTGGAAWSWNLMWNSAFGGTMFENQDYSKTTINSKGSALGMEYIKSWVTLGYAPPHPNEQIDDRGIEGFAQDRLFSCTLQTGHVIHWMRQAVDAGLIDGPFEYTFMEAPHDPDYVEHSGYDCYQWITVAHKSDSEDRNKVVADWANYLTKEATYISAVLSGDIPTLKEIDRPLIGEFAKPSVQALLKVAREAPPLDSGRQLTQRREIFKAWEAPIQAFMNDKMTVEEALVIMERETNRLLAE